MKKKNILLSLLLFSSIVYILVSLYLGRMGYGFYLFKQKLPYDMNVSYDPYAKFRIMEHDIIYALAIGDSIPVEPDSKIVVVKSIDRYSYNFSTNFVAFEITDTRDSIIKVQYSVVKERKNGSLIRFIPLNKDMDSLNWIDVRINKNLLVSLHGILRLSVLSMIILVFCILRTKKKNDE